MQTEKILFGQLPGDAAKRWPNLPALSFENKRFTYAQLNDEVNRAARALLARGIKKGDSVGMWITNRPELIIAFFAIQKIGAVGVPLNTRYREHDLGFVLRHSECKLLFTVDRSGPVDYVGILEKVVPGFKGGVTKKTPEFPHLENVVIVSATGAGGEASWDHFLKGADAVSEKQLEDAAASVKHEDFALIVFTSGTTGNPKGVLHDNSCAFNIKERAAMWPLGEGDVNLNYLPVFHVYGLGEIVIASFFTGTHQILMDSFDPNLALDIVEKEKVKGLHGFETHWADLLRVLDSGRKVDLSSVKFGTFPAGQESSTAVARIVNERICPTVTGFGMSETWGWVCTNAPEDPLEQRVATSGKPMKGLELKIVDPVTGEEVPNNEMGEICMRGYTVMRGYFREPEATARTIDKDGWLHTGDQGYKLDDGCCVFKGRYKEMLKVGGENVSPAAVETELLALVPEIDQIAVVGYPDPRLMEVPAAYIVPKAGKTVTLESVTEKCKGKIASFKIPKHVLIVPSLPATASGKVQRVLLKAQVLKDLPPT